MIEIIKSDKILLLKYQADRSDDMSWVDDKIEQEGSFSLPRSLRHVFTFRPNDLLPTLNPDDARVFVLGTSDNDGYYKIKANILALAYDMRLHMEMDINRKTFIADRDISIFAKIDHVVEDPIIIGGTAEGAIPIEEFEYLQKKFPTPTELSHYSDSRITRILKDYFGKISDAQQKLSAYLEGRERRLLATADKGRQSHQNVRNKLIAPYEIDKFEYVRDELKEMLQNVDSYLEKDWQKLIINFLLLLFPQYIAVLPNLHIKDFYTGPKKVTDRYIDIALVDAAGTIDVVEIKQPFARCILSNKPDYRDNYTPRKELSGAVMQVEKYLFYLNKWGYAGEKEILENRKDELPDGLEIKITNPKGIIILGRDTDFKESQQWLDYEIIRRKYANLVDIITYDDLLRRLDNIITMLRRPTVAGAHGSQP